MADGGSRGTWVEESGADFDRHPAARRLMNVLVWDDMGDWEVGGRLDEVISSSIKNKLLQMLDQNFGRRFH